MTEELSQMWGKKTQLQEGVNLDGSRNARDRTGSLQGSEDPLGDDKKQPQHSLVDHPGTGALRGPSSEAQAQRPHLGNRAGLGDGPMGGMLHATALRIGVDARVYKELLVTYLSRFYTEQHIVLGL